ncbi:hypothetical protein ACERIT_01095 [Halopenitus sp. H-Gu1]|uniref:hypothetical protein n=1 Tax=Halopenitus sp. H-Gu1 TaxID=3242697 RepID=UPI00359E4705
MGSLAAGAAAVTGTGAFSNITASRAASFSIAADNNAYLAMSAPDSLENGEHAQVDGSSNELVVNFNSNSTTGGSGLNPDAETWFDAVFQLTNQGTQPIDIVIDDDNLAHSDRIVFYVDGSALPDANTDSTGGLYAIEGYPGSAEGPDVEDDDKEADETTDNGQDYWKGYANPKLSAGSSVSVGIYVDTTGMNSLGQFTSGDVVVRASENLNQ